LIPVISIGTLVLMDNRRIRWKERATTTTAIAFLVGALFTGSIAYALLHDLGSSSNKSGLDDLVGMILGAIFGFGALMITIVLSIFAIGFIWSTWMSKRITKQINKINDSQPL
jgi:uncharacterized membrane protein required for colicin V production